MDKASVYFLMVNTAIEQIIKYVFYVPATSYYFTRCGDIRLVVIGSYFFTMNCIEDLFSKLLHGLETTQQCLHLSLVGLSVV